jgi:Uma2 family endonuclease
MHLRTPISQAILVRAADRTVYYQTPDHAARSDDFMTLATAKSRLTADEFMALPHAHEYELVEGSLVERKFIGAYSSYVAGRIIYLLNALSDRTGCGWVLDSETTYRCFGDPDTLRRADVSFVRVGRFPNERVPEAYVTIAPDLAMEVISPTNLAYEVQEKIRLYIEAGVRLIWVVYPNTEQVQVYDATGFVAELEADETISGGDVVPGFSARVSDFFKRPVPPEQT